PPHRGPHAHLDPNVFSTRYGHATKSLEFTSIQKHGGGGPNTNTRRSLVCSFAYTPPSLRPLLVRVAHAPRYQRHSCPGVLRATLFQASFFRRSRTCAELSATSALRRLSP